MNNELGTGGFRSMQDLPAATARLHRHAEDLVAGAKTVAGDVANSPNHAVVVDAYAAAVGELTQVAERIGRLYGLSRKVDATQWASAEEVAGRPDPEAWHRR